MDKKWMKNYIKSNVMFLGILMTIYAFSAWLKISFVWIWLILGACWTILLFFMGIKH